MMQQPTETGLRFVLAAAIAAMGVQIGRLSWQATAEAQAGARVVYAAPRYPLDAMSTNDQRPTTNDRREPWLRAPSSKLQVSGTGSQEAEAWSQGEATGTRPSFVGPQMPGTGSFFPPPGPDYEGKPLPLPSQDQLRFLAVRGLLGPDGRAVTQDPADALRIAGTDQRPTTNDQRPTTNDQRSSRLQAPSSKLPTPWSRDSAAGVGMSGLPGRMIGPPVPVRHLAGAAGSPTGPALPGTMAQVNGGASGATSGKVSPLRQQSGKVSSGVPATGVGGNVTSGWTAVGRQAEGPPPVASGVRNGQSGNVAGGAPPTALGGNVASGARDVVSPGGKPFEAQSERTRLLAAAPRASEGPVGSSAATVATSQPATGERLSTNDQRPTTNVGGGTNGGSTVGGEGRQPEAQTGAEAPLQLRLTVTEVGEGVGPGRMARVRVTASAPCHLALYRIGAGGRISALLSLAGAARMRAAASYSLATAMQAGDRLVALGARRPLTGREAQACLRAFLEEGGDCDPAEAPDAVPLSQALQRLAAVAGAHTGRASGTALARSAWAVATASLPGGGTARGVEAGAGPAPG